MTDCWLSFNFDPVLEECRILVSFQETDLEWREKLAEEQACGLYPFDGSYLLVELEELCERVARVESEHATEAMELSWLVREISDNLVDLGVFPIQDIAQCPNSAQDVLMAVGLVSERLREEHRSMSPDYPVCHLFFCFWCGCNVHIHIPTYVIVQRNLKNGVPTSLHHQPQQARVPGLVLDTWCILGEGCPS
jgi:hypothetical protein